MFSMEKLARIVLLSTEHVSLTPFFKSNCKTFPSQSSFSFQEF